MKPNDSKMPPTSHPKAASSVSDTNANPTISSSTTNSVRRTLFQGHLSRRAPASTTSTSASTTQAPSTLVEDNGAEIVERDAKGDYRMDFDPSKSAEALAAVEASDKKREAEANFSVVIRRALRDQRHNNKAQCAELITAVQASLQTDVAALSGDNWMFEAEEDM